jgi:hypothetical protein
MSLKSLEKSAAIGALRKFEELYHPRIFIEASNRLRAEMNAASRNVE